jgi:hypothetical protein
MKSTERRTAGNMPFPFDLLARRSFLKEPPHVQLDPPWGLSRTYAILNSVRSTSEIRVAFMPLPTHEIGNWRSSRRRVGLLPSTKKRHYREPICCTPWSPDELKLVVRSRVARRPGRR